MKPALHKVALALGACLLLTGVLLAGAAVAGAAGEQALQAVPSYVNPLSGKIEDTGNNPGLGQGMTENLVKKTPTTLLVDNEGSTFITFRVGLVKESKDFAIELLDGKGKVKEAVPYSIVATQPDADTQDLRIKVPSQDAVLRVSLISIPMGREVVGFVKFAPEGETVTVPTTKEETDNAAISIYQNSNNDKITGVSQQNRGKLLTFLGIAAGILLLIGAAAAIVYVRKKKSRGNA